MVFGWVKYLLASLVEGVKRVLRAHARVEFVLWLDLFLYRQDDRLGIKDPRSNLLRWLTCCSDKAHLVELLIDFVDILARKIHLVNGSLRYLSIYA